MVTTTTKTIGALLLIIATTLIVVINIQHGLKIDVSKNDTKFYIYNMSGDNAWTLSGTETWVIYMNNKMYKPNSATLKNVVLKNNMTEILRTVKYTSSNVTIIDKYTFDGNDKTIEAFPIKHTINVTCKNCTYKYTYKLFNNRMNIDYEQPDAMNLTTLSYIVNGNRIINIRMYDPLWNISGNYTKNTPSLDPNVSYITSHLNCSVYADMTNFTNITYANGTNYTIYYWYFKNGVQQTSYNTLSYHNTTPVAAYAPLATTETLTLSDIWHCRVRMTTTSGTVLYTTPILISNYVTIQNSAPVITPISPLGTDVNATYGYNATGGTKIDINGLTLHNITYSGANQTFNVSPSIDIPVTIMMWGAGGGGSYIGGWAGGSNVGGGGGYTTLNVTLKAGQNYTIVVGQGGRAGSSSTNAYTFGGGGPNCVVTMADCQYSGSGGGGSFLYNSTTLLAAAGGGGGGGNGYPPTCGAVLSALGGAGGGLIGQNGTSDCAIASIGRGANQTAPGAASGGEYPGTSGVGQLGGYPGLNSYGGGGGGGYYGGGGGGYATTGGNSMSGGGGGSGYVINGGTTTTGSYNTPANNNSIYRGTAATGGAVNTAGGNGLVIITYNNTFVYMTPSTVYTDANTPAILAWTGTDANGDILRYEVYSGNITNNSLLYNGTNSSYTWTNATNQSMNYSWYVKVYDATLSTISLTNIFTISFMNWSVVYSPGVTAFTIRPNASTGTFYPTNQSTLYGMFNITNFESSDINISVNLSKGLSKNTDLYFYTQPAYKTCYQESANITNQSGTDTQGCGLNYTGIYSISCGDSAECDGGVGDQAQYVIDGNWSTQATMNSELNISVNYTYPTISSVQNITGATIKASQYGIVHEYTLPSSCIKNPVELKYLMPLSGIITFYCKDSVNWTYVGNISDLPSIFEEEAIYWNVSTTLSTIMQKSSYTDYYDKFNGSVYTVNSSPLVYYSCLQDFANQTTTCGGLATGNYSVNGLWNDGNWSTGTVTAANYYVNYTKPVNVNTEVYAGIYGVDWTCIWSVDPNCPLLYANSSYSTIIIGMNESETTTNASNNSIKIPISCWNVGNTLQFKFTQINTSGKFGVEQGIVPYCYNIYGAWQYLRWNEAVNTPAHQYDFKIMLYEEQMNWSLLNTSTTTTNFTTEAIQKNVTVNRASAYISVLSGYNGSFKIYANNTLIYNTTNTTTLQNVSIDITTILRSYLGNCSGTSCSMPFYVNSTNITTWNINNLSIRASGQPGSTTETVLGTVPAGLSYYIFSKAIYNNSGLGGTYTVNWKATK